VEKRFDLVFGPQILIRNADYYDGYDFIGFGFAWQSGAGKAQRH